MKLFFFWISYIKIYTVEIIIGIPITECIKTNLVGFIAVKYPGNKLGLSLMSNIESFIPKLDFKSSKTIKKPTRLPELDKYEFCNK